MDGNSKQVDLGRFTTGVMVPKFEKAVKEHKKGDIFLVDVDASKWYYVALKTYANRESEKLTFITVKEE